MDIVKFGRKPFFIDYESIGEGLGSLCKKGSNCSSKDGAARVIFSQKISRPHRRMDCLG